MFPRCSQALVNIGYILQSEKKFKKALHVFHAAQEVDPAYAATFEAKGILHLILRNNFAALIDISKATVIYSPIRWVPEFPDPIIHS